MKKGFFGTFLCCILLLICFYYRDDIARYAMNKVNQNTRVKLPDSNNYYNNIDYQFVQKTDDFHVKNYQGMLNAIYTILNNGASEFKFYCDENYVSCLDDFNRVSEDQILLSTINNLVSPYNSYQKVYFKSNSFGEITMSIDKLYSEDEIQLSESKIDDFIKNNITDNMNAEEKIKAFHDYIINNSVYDKQRAEAIEGGDDVNLSRSHKSIGPLVDGISLCSGYSDAMKIFLDKLGITSYKISNDDHIWNLIYINNQWLHLDITWDDPVTNTGVNLLLHKFFLIDTNTLHELDPNGHNYNPDYYPEVRY